ncbi:MAG: hydantoinase/oxoprolinase family protein, partial [Pseudomonadota bacterium]
RHDRVQTVNAMLESMDLDDLAGDMRQVADDLTRMLQATDVSFDSIETRFELDMLYLGQTHSVAVPIELPTDVTAIAGAFDTAYQAAYGRLLADIPKRVMNYRVAVIGRRPDIDMRVFAPDKGQSVEACLLGYRQVYAHGAPHDTPRYDRLALAVGETVIGPALLEQPDTTIFVDPGLKARVDNFGNLVITRDEDT